MNLCVFGLRSTTRDWYQSGRLPITFIRQTREPKLTEFSVIFNGLDDRQHFIECPNRILKADLSPLNAAFQGGFTHPLSNPIVGNRMSSNLVSKEMRFFAAQVLRLHRRL